MIVASPSRAGGKVVHSYTDHASILKIIERHWKLAPLTTPAATICRTRSPRPDNPYVPTNSPAIGDLFDMSTSGRARVTPTIDHS